MFVIRKGDYQISKQEYTYARRAQASVQTLHWRDCATINTDDLEEAIAEANEAIAQWSKVYTSSKWQLEGRGKTAAMIPIDLSVRSV